MIHIPIKDSGFNSMCLIDTETGKEFVKIKDIEDLEVIDDNADIENIIDIHKFYSKKETAFSRKEPILNVDVLCAAIGVAALGKNKVKAILLPQHEQSDIDHSLQLVKHLDIDYKIINIGSTVDSIVGEMKNGGVEPTQQALINVAARIRMTELYFYAQCVNGIPSCNCNLSEDWIGWSTFGGDGFGSFAPLSNLTMTEVKAIGYELGLPKKLIEKTPIDGLCGKTDEESFGFSYEVLDRYIRTGEIDDMNIKAKIDTMHEKNLFKLQLMPSFEL